MIVVGSLNSKPTLQDFCVSSICLYFQFVPHFPDSLLLFRAHQKSFVHMGKSGGACVWVDVW